jgi:hypothetical protein
MNTTREEKRMNKVVGNLLRARALLLGADFELNLVYDYILDCEKAIDIIDKNLAYFPEDVKRIDESYYNLFLKKKD